VKKAEYPRYPYVAEVKSPQQCGGSAFPPVVPVFQNRAPVGFWYRCPAPDVFSAEAPKLKLPHQHKYYR